MLHIPSLSSVTINTNCIGKPFIAISFHVNKKILNISYKNWESCEKDFNRIKTAISEVEHLLNSISLTEPEAKAEEAAKYVEKTLDQNNITDS